MPKKKTIPQSVTDLMQEELTYEGHIEFLGSRKGVDYFFYVFDEDVEIGFPSVISMNDGLARKLEPDESVEIISLFCKD